MGGQRRRRGRTEKEKWEDREGEVGGQRRRRGRTEKEKWKEKDAKWNKVEELRQKGYAVNSGDFLNLMAVKIDSGAINLWKHSILVTWVGSATCMSIITFSSS